MLVAVALTRSGTAPIVPEEPQSVRQCVGADAIMPLFGEEIYSYEQLLRHQ